MTGRFLIDGIDAYAEFGVFVADTGLLALLQYPSLKKVNSVDWHEEDGEEFDLSAPVLDAKTVQIKFGAHKVNRVGGFIEALSDMSYHDFEFVSLGRAFRLRLVDQQALVVLPTWQTFSLQLADYFPLEGYDYQAPISRYGKTTGYEIDGIDLGQYDVQVLEGSLAEVLKSPAVKQNLLRNIGSKSGAIYDGEVVTFKTKDVKINLVMMASNFEDFWRNYDAFLYDLTRSDERKLYVDSTGLEYPCYYKNCTSTKFVIIKGKIWFVFSITLVFTSFRVGDDDYLLASENSELFVLEEDDETFIDMGYGN